MRDDITFRPPHDGELPLLADLQTAYYQSCGIDAYGDPRLLQHTIDWCGPIPREWAITVAEAAGHVVGWFELGHFRQADGAQVFRHRLVPAPGACREVGPRLVAIAEARLQQVSGVTPPVIGTWCHDAEQDLRSVVATYADHRRMLSMRRDTALLHSLSVEQTSRRSKPDLVAVADLADLSPLRAFHHRTELGAVEGVSNDAFFALPDWNWQDSLVAKSGGDVVGAALFRRHKQQHCLEWLAVAPVWRQQGLAGSLLRTALRRLHKQGCELVVLDVAEDNLVARHLYTSTGFSLESGANWSVRRL